MITYSKKCLLTGFEGQQKMFQDFSWAKFRWRRAKCMEWKSGLTAYVLNLHILGTSLRIVRIGIYDAEADR